MSATLDGGPVAALLGGAPIVTSEGRSPSGGDPLPSRRAPGTRIEAAVAAVVREALAADAGRRAGLPPGRRARSAAPRRCSEGWRRTWCRFTAACRRRCRTVPCGPARRAVERSCWPASIAETSLTIDGVRVVVDGGLARVPRVFAAERDDPPGHRSRVPRLGRPAAGPGRTPGARASAIVSGARTRTLTLAAAGRARDSRDRPGAAGARAGRCRARRSGRSSPGSTRRPPRRSPRRGALLAQLGALDAAGRITAHGRRLTRFALHPRLAHMVVRARELGAGEAACELAALLSERDLLRRQDGQAGRGPGAPARAAAGTSCGAPTWTGTRSGGCARRPGSAAEAGSAARGGHTERRLGGRAPGVRLPRPDRASGGRARRAGSCSATARGPCSSRQALAREEYLVAAELDGQAPREPDLPGGRRSRWTRSSALRQRSRARRMYSEWDEAARARSSARRRRRLGALVLQEGPLPDPDPAAVARGDARRPIRRDGVERLPWSEPRARLRARAGIPAPRWIRAGPTSRPRALAASWTTWLGAAPRRGCGGWRTLERLDLGGAAAGSARAGTAARRSSDWAPTHRRGPERVARARGLLRSGGPGPGGPATGAVRADRDPARWRGGRVPLTLHLLIAGPPAGAGDA